MSYASVNAICTYDALADNKCIFNGITYNMTEMCSHQIYNVG